MFTKDQIKRLSNILDNIGQIVLASIIIPLVLGSVGLTFIQVILWFTTMILSWWAALRLERISS